MIACGKWVKRRYDGALTCFIGPCIAKKAETLRNRDVVDFAMTYEELMCIFEGTKIDLNVPPEDEYNTSASAGGIGFPLHRGVQNSLNSVLEKSDRPEPAMEYADGLDRCHEKLAKIKSGDLSIDYIEGMACRNGCIDGPGTLSQFGMTRVLVEKYAKAAEKKTSDENAEARSQI